MAEASPGTLDVRLKQLIVPVAEPTARKAGLAMHIITDSLRAHMERAQKANLRTRIVLLDDKQSPQYITHLRSKLPIEARGCVVTDIATSINGYYVDAADIIASRVSRLSKLTHTVEVIVLVSERERPMMQSLVQDIYTHLTGRHTIFPPIRFIPYDAKQTMTIEWIDSVFQNVRLWWIRRRLARIRKQTA